MIDNGFIFWYIFLKENFQLYELQIGQDFKRMATLRLIFN
jgi:hypothetical protein